MQGLIVLGGGPGGYIAAFEAAKQAKKLGLDLQVTIVERARLGGTCLNAGCIPTKIILSSAHALSSLAQMSEFAVTGLDSTSAKIDLDALRTRKDGIINELVGQIEAGAQKLGIEVVTGTGRLVSTGSEIEVAVKDESGEESVHTCDALIIATGAVSTQVPALDAPFVWTSDDALALSEIPDSIIIVGGGVMGVEFASAYAQLGSKVTIVELAKSLLATLDKRIAKTLTRDFKAQGIELHLGTSVQSVEQDAQGRKTARLSCGKEISADIIMSAIGTVPNTAGLGFKEAGINFEGPAIAVDESCETNIANVYAIGDAIGGLMLAHEAEHEGVIAARAIVAKIAGLAQQNSHTLGSNLIPGCIYTAPEIATIGMGTSCAKEQGIEAVAGIAKYSANGKALAEGEADGFVQIVAEAHTGQVLGAQIVGAKAVELIAAITPYMMQKASVTDIVDTVFAHPTLSEAIKLAAEAAQEKLKA